MEELHEAISRWSQFDSQVECQEEGDKPGRWGKIAAWVAGFITKAGMEIPTRELTPQQQSDLSLFARDLGSTGKNLELPDLRRMARKVKKLMDQEQQNRLLTKPPATTNL
jgi:hypothetical protein